MAIIYSQDFDPGTGPFLGCGGSTCAVCFTGAAIAHAVPNTTEGTFRFQLAVFSPVSFEADVLIVADFGHITSLCPDDPIPFQIVLYVETDGSLRVRTTTGFCDGATPLVDDYTTAPAALPIDGLFHGVQFGLSISGGTVTWTLVVDNAAIDTRAITPIGYPLSAWTAFDAFVYWLPNIGFPASLLVAIDSFEVEDSVLITDFPACSSPAPLSQLTCFFIPPVSNQTCQTAQHLGSVPVDLFEDCRGSTADGSPVIPSCAASPDDPTTRNNPLWFRFTPDHDGHYAIGAVRLNDSQPLPCLSVWCPSCESLHEYLCRDYSIPLPGPPPPENVTCAMATPVSLFPYTVQLDLTALGDPPEVSPSCGGSSRPVWWRLTVPLSAAHLVITTDGSSYDTVIGLYTGPCEALVEIDCNDDDFSLGNPRNSTISRDVTPGDVYYVLVLAYTSGPSGGGTLVVSIDETTPHPPITPDDVRGFFQAGHDYLILTTAPTDLSETYGNQSVHLTVQEVVTSAHFPPSPCQEIGPPGVTLPC